VPGAEKPTRRPRKPKAAAESNAQKRRKPTFRDRKRSRPKLGRLRAGEAIYLVAAILLFVLMFLTWFQISDSQQAGAVEEVIVLGRGGDAWQTLEVIPLFLMLAIVVAVGAALLRLGRSQWKPAIAPGAAVTVLGLVAALLILIRIISPPGLGTPELAGYEFSTSLQLPVFLALAAALGIAYGGWRAMAEEGTSFGDVAKRLESPKRPKPSAGPKRPERSKPAPEAKPASGSKS
jgi:hypothetical protein